MVARRPVSLTSEARARTRFAWLLLLPTLVVVALVALVPLLQTVWMSFTDARLGSLVRSTS